jgi:ABC-type branched-subunit amino acid transport system ATPase component
VPAAAEPVLAVEALAKSFGGLRAIDGLSLELRAGEILGIVGPNGAGKSVLVNLVTGFYRPSAGAIRFKGRPTAHLARHRISRLGIARTFQHVRLFRRMTVLENVLVADKRDAAAPFAALFGGAARRRRDVARAMEFLSLMGLADRADRPAGTLAYGDARRLEIARALAGEPAVLFLDEPAAGMNDAETAALVEDVRTCRGLVEAIGLIEHDMSLVRALSDRIVAIDCGRKLAEGTPDEVFADPAFVAAYLGAEVSDA